MSPRLRHTLFALPFLLPLAEARAEDPLTPALVADFAPGDARVALSPSWLAGIGGRIYFQGAEPLFGNEPWSSDGTLAGTARIADLCPGPCSSEPRQFQLLGGRVVFLTGSALMAFGSGGAETLLEFPGRQLGAVRAGDRLFLLFEDPEGARLFASDGTAAGTGPITGLCGEPFCPPPDGWSAAGGFFFFIHERELYAAPIGGAPRRLTPLGSLGELGSFDGFRFYFRGGGAEGYWLWTSDGTPEGTRALAPLSDTGDRLVPWRGRVYFTGRDGLLGSSDGTAAGTRRETAVSGPAQALAANAHFLFYQAGPAGPEPHVLHALDAAGGDAALLAASARFEKIGQAGERPFFYYYEYSNEGSEGRLAASDGTAAGTTVIEGLKASGPGAALGDRLFFTAPSEPFFGISLWTSDGTAAGTAELAIPALEHLSSHPQAFPLGSSLVVTTFLGPTWRVDPITFERELLSEQPLRIAAQRPDALFAAAGQYPDAHLFAIRESGIREVTTEPVGNVAVADGGLIYFSSSLPGQQLWQSDGTPEGTRQLFDLEPGWQACGTHHCTEELPARITPSGGRVFFIAGGGEGELYHQLWVWPGDGGAPRALLPLYIGTPLTALTGGRVAAPIPDPATGITTYWVSDGSLEGTRPFASLPFGFEVGGARRVGERLIFTAGGWLWASDGAEPPRPIAPATGDPARWPAAGDHLFYPGAGGLGLGFSDGTPAGTFAVPAAGGSGAAHLATLADQRVVFAAGSDAGSELWISDGTAAGTARLTDLAPGFPGSDPDSFAQVGGRLFFQADDGNTGHELWAIDLPPARPSCPADRLCLMGGRYELKAQSNLPGLEAAARRELGNAESGVMSLFSPGNWELLARVAEAFPGSGRCYLEVSSASSLPLLVELEDRASGVPTFEALNSEPYFRVRFRAEIDCAGPFEAAEYSPAEPAAATPRRCAGDPAALCLGEGGRFRVSAGWQGAGAAGPAAPVWSSSAESGLFALASPGRPDLLVKVLDGCAINGSFWVFAADTAETGWELQIEDRRRGRSRSYRRAAGDESSALRDIAAFACP